MIVKFCNRCGYHNPECFCLPWEKTPILQGKEDMTSESLFEYIMRVSNSKEFKEAAESLKEMVDHPSHYKGKKLEVIDVISDFELNFFLGNAIKYILRAGKKGEKTEDLKKALWYIQREIE